MPRYKIPTKEELKKLCEQNYSYAEVIRKLGRPISGSSYATIKKYIQMYGIDISHFTGKNWNTGKTAQTDKRLYNTSLSRRTITNEEIFQKNTEERRSIVRQRVLIDKLIDYRCIECGNSGLWRDKELSLHLDHINGDPSDNRLENLRWLCPNCHATTSTWGSKNKVEDYENKQKEKQNRKEEKQFLRQNKCIDCQKIIDSKATRCRGCENENRRKNSNVTISREELKQKIRVQSFESIGRDFGVSGNAIRKWAEKRNLPRTKQIILSYSDEEWAKI